MTGRKAAPFPPSTFSRQGQQVAFGPPLPLPSCSLSLSGSDLVQHRHTMRTPCSSWLGRGALPSFMESGPQDVSATASKSKSDGFYFQRKILFG